MEKVMEQLINVWMRNQLANQQVLDEADEPTHLSDESIKKVYTQFTISTPFDITILKS